MELASRDRDIDGAANIGLLKAFGDTGRRGQCLVGSWDREKFAAAHILFRERNSEYDYMVGLFAEQPSSR
jgi:hypothetical protein